MGNLFGKREAVCIPEMQRLSYDMSPLQEITAPMIWLVGAPGSGRNTQAGIIEDTYGFDVIKVGTLLKKYSSNETDRGRVIKENIDRKDGIIPDTIVIDIIKEEMLARARWSCGFVLNGFPKNKNQADMFINEVGSVDVIIYLQCSFQTMLTRRMTSDEKINPVDLKDEVKRFEKTLMNGIRRFSAKIEKFDTSKTSPDAIFPRIQSAINVRVFTESNMEKVATRKIIAE